VAKVLKDRVIQVTESGSLSDGSERHLTRCL